MQPYNFIIQMVVFPVPVEMEQDALPIFYQKKTMIKKLYSGHHLGH